ncbi:hypothetical protein [Thauera phenylacetica]
MTHDTATRLENLKQVLRAGNLDIAAAADMLEFLHGLAKREPDAIPLAELERIDTKVVALLAQKAALDSALATLLKGIQTSPDAARAGQLIDLLFVYLEQRSAEVAEERITPKERARRMMDAYRPTPRQKNE